VVHQFFFVIVNVVSFVARESNVHAEVGSILPAAAVASPRGIVSARPPAASVRPAAVANSVVRGRHATDASRPAAVARLLCSGNVDLVVECLLCVSVRRA